MKKLFAVALAIGLSSAAQAGSFSGCWGELSVGAMVADTAPSIDWNGTNVASLDGIASQGLMGGLGVGCDYRVEKAIIGIFGRLDYNRAESELSIMGTTIGTLKFDPTYTIAARIGMEVNASTMAYVMGGMAWSKIKAEGFGSEIAADLRGWVVGAGLETMISGQWSGKLEYSFTRFDSVSMFTSGPLDVRVEPDVHVVRAGLVYRFGTIELPK